MGGDSILYSLPGDANKSWPEHNSFDDKSWILKLVDFTKKVLAQDRVRLIGVCFGHQIIGRAMGVKVGRSDKGWELAVLPFSLTAKGKEIFQKESIVSGHRQGVSDRLTKSRTSISCIATLSTSIRRGLRRWGSRRCAARRQCTPRDGSLRCRAIRNSTTG